jgi:Periplasmic binding protein
MTRGRRWNPLAGLARSWGHFSRRRRSTQLRTLVLVGAVLAGVGVWIATAPSGSISAAPSGSGLAQGQSGSPGTSLQNASTSTRGVSANSINVVFPIVALNSLAGQEGFARDAEFGEQQKAIELYVKQVNDEGGINGRKLNAIVTGFDPASETDMRSLCKTWTEGSPAAFAVVDGEGAWTGDNQLCITQEGHTPFIGQWTTVTNWTTLGSPYLWWTGPDQAAVLRAVVSWGLSAQLLGSDRKVGIVVGDRASDQLALKDYLLPDLQRAGVTPVVVKTIASDPAQTATTNAEAPLAVQELRSDGVDSLIPLVPFNVFYPLLQAETAQHYFPRLLLSDYESGIQSALGLIPVPYAGALDGQEGVTTETLGGVDDDRPASLGGYDPGVRSCFETWHRAYPQIPPGNMSFYIEEQGPVAGWCQAVRLFATAARTAGRDLDRRTFVTAMSQITGYPGAWAPVLSFGPDKRYGPTEYQVVRLHVNSPPSAQCKLPKNGVPQGTCWVSVRPFVALPSG